MVVYSNFAELHPEGRNLCIGYLNRAAGQHDPFTGLYDLWIGFAAWMACITEADLDAEMVRAIGADERMAAALEALKASDGQFNEQLAGFSRWWPIYRSQDVARRYGHDYPYRFSTREDFTASIAEDARIRRSPEGWETGMEPKWKDLVAAVYQVRCNLVHGRKSLSREADQSLVDQSYRLLSRFIDYSRCIEWR